MGTRFTGAGLLIALGVAAASAAQQPGTGRRPTLSVETDLVTLSVTVVDGHGAIVPGLTQDHFKVYDDGQLQTIDFFTNEDIPATVGLVLDCSTSMRGHRDAVTAAATAFAAVSHPQDEFFTMNFNEAVWPGLPPPQLFAHDVEDLRRALVEAPARGKTALFDAVEQALDHLELGTRGRKALIVVSDGGDNASRHTLDDVLVRARRTRAVIYTVALVDPDDHDANPGVLRTLAKETGGTALEPARADEVMAAFNRIALEIRGGYTLGFTPVHVRRDGFRSIRVVVDDVDHHRLTARTRRGYYAASVTPID